MSDGDSSVFRVTTSVPQVVVMEGPLKKRGATMPVMRDRYCVATWERVEWTDPTHHPASYRKAVVLRTYKTRKSYDKQPDKPVSVHTLKCVSEWNGKGNFHKYPHGFCMETQEQKVFQCAAPSAEEKDKWIELMATVVTPRTASDEPVARGSTDGSHSEVNHHRGARASAQGGLFDDDDDHDGADARHHGQWTNADDLRDAENDLLSGDDYYAGNGSADEGHLLASPVSPLALSSPDDKLFRGASSGSSQSSQGGHEFDHDDEPDDWGIYGDKEGNGPSQYDIVDGPVMSLDKELLRGTSRPTMPLASDEFLFEQNGPTFGAVVVLASAGGNVSDDFVDPVLQERRDRKKKEKQLKRVTKKLESNRDLYAEMAAARLKTMRKDAKTKPRQSITHRRRGEADDDSVWTSEDEEEEEEMEMERSRVTSIAGSLSRHSSMSMVTSETSKVASETPRATAHFELEEIDTEEEAYLRRQSTLRKSKKKEKREKQRSEPVESQLDDDVELTDGLFEDLLFGDTTASTSNTLDDHQAVAARSVAEEHDKEAEDEEEARRRRKEHRRLKRQQQLKEAARLEEEERKRAAAMEAAATTEPVQEGDEDEEQRVLRKQRMKEERRRLRKERERREAADAASAEELARQQRELARQQDEEELRQERRERKERKKQKEKIVLDKKAKELKRREAELAAEAEKLKQTQDALLKADESKDTRKKKRRDKYTSPADRIQRREKEAEAHASDMSTALVVVEPAAPPVQSAPASMAVPEAATPAPEPEPAPTQAPPVSAPVVVVAQAAASVPYPDVAAPPQSAPVPVPQPLPAQPTAFATPPQSAPSHFAVPPPQAYYPGYPPPSPYQVTMPYSAPYPAVHYNPGYPAVPYGPGMAMPSPYYPHLGYVGGVAPMAPAQMQPPFAMMQAPSFMDPSEEAFIGPQLPSPKSFPTEDSAPLPAAPAPTASTVPSVPPSKSSAGVVLPDLPDVTSF